MMKKYLIAALLPVPVAALANDDAIDETWNLKGQATYVWQR
ncbi:MAG: hypothetical protein GAK35_02483 [Herbaspirillum frisingense]|uniref:Uncharacterized protein n=1 Tax=Herbaspirillum frisingense TaxID=92645 RepID=A0A7V8FW06_9BURK|nr:MAG: hypothetical protein GAK35_02483 [Herbaspirillum frisingense]